jgi:hypothetical protein
MKPAILIPFLLAAGAGCGQRMTCQMVAGDHIHAADMAVVAPAFAALDPSVEIGLAPVPGIKRVFRSGDLLQLARDHGIEHAPVPTEICFERPGAVASRTPRVAAPIPAAVKSGDKVAVRVTTGGVLLTFESEAASSGRVGDSVIVLNPANGNRFVARVQDHGKVVVQK